jgi:hypothetical protein
LNAAGKKQLAAVEARIARSAELSGITNPVPKGLEDSKDIEADLEKFNADSVKPMGNLSEGEIEYINQLEQKEVTNGLTDEEESTLNKLYLKRVARPKVVRPRRLTAHEIRSLAEAPPVTVQEGPAGEDFLSSGVPEGVLRSQQKEKVFPDAYLSLDDNIKLRGLKQMNQTAEVEQQQRELIQKAEMKRNFEKKTQVEKPKYSVQQVAQWVKELSSAFPRMPDFIVAPSTKMFRNVKGREHLVDEWDRTEGMFFQNEPNTIYIFSDRIKSKRDLGKLMLHEMFHLGFHNYMTAQEKSQFLQMMLAAKGELIMNRVADYHPELNTARAASAYDPRVQAKLQEAMLIQAEEVLATEAENNPKDSLIDRIAAFFARVVRRLFPDLKITMPEIRVLIRDVGAWSRNKSAVTERNYRQVSEPFRKREFSRLIGR